MDKTCNKHSLPNYEECALCVAQENILALRAALTSAPNPSIPLPENKRTQRYENWYEGIRKLALNRN